MQAQYNVASSSCPSSLGYYHHISEAYSTIHDQYFPTGGDNYPGSFSRGSSDTLAYPTDEAYHYMTDRGGPSSAVGNNTAHMSTVYSAPATTTSMSFDATGIGYTDTVIPAVCVSGREYHQPEDISVPYDHGRGWEWECPPTTLQPTLPPPHHPHPHPLTHQHLHAPTLPQLPTALGASALLPHDATFLDLTSAIKSAVSTVGQAQQPYPGQSSSPVAQLPTPASMYVSLNSGGGGGGGRGREETPQISVAGDSPVAVVAAASLPPPITQMPAGAADAATGVMPVPDMLSREKKHACTMCHKRFDRPSTLRKHLLVHTGEKAFVCDTCGRRFGVASNLNRHVRRCILKPVNASLATTQAPSSSMAGGSNTTSSDVSSSNQHDVPTVKTTSSAKRGRASSSSESASSTSSSSSSQSHGSKGGVDGAGSTKAPGQKRRRRAPSPSLWVPWSLRAFNLSCEEFHRSTPVPLPPVRRNLPGEERDSWDDDVSARPYHPHEWRGVLPGPGLGHGFGLGAKDIQNVNFGGSGGIMLGRVLVF